MKPASPHAFAKVLVANRGEIAVRILKSAHSCGYRSVAVYSDADAEAPHAAFADEAVRIGPAAARESYLDIAAVIQAAKLAGADAIHPGYGFLSENADFAAACAEAGLVFIGPPAEAIRAMGNKAAAKRLMIEAKVPCVPGYEGREQNDERLIREATRIGLPIMIKAAAGGGGKGMRRVDEASAFEAALSAARGEAMSAFGSDELILEKALTEARHIEIQIFADTLGHVIHLGERDCSIQRRHQKVIEEAPAPGMSPELRRRMGEAAVAAARAIDYVGAGTVEFLLDADGEFYFLEMNTRLQVEHRVTEQVTGQDLVAWQFKVARGEPLPLTQDQVVLAGHAIEARLYAEDPYRGFLPQSGRVALFEPVAGEGVVIDHALGSGQEISPYYDPMIAKLIASGETREEARRRLIRALEESAVLGLSTNRRFLIDLLEDEVFIAGRATTALIPERFSAADPRMAAPEPDPSTNLLALALFFERNAPRAGADRLWHSTGRASWPLRLARDDRTIEARVRPQGPGRYRIELGGETQEIHLLQREGSAIRFAIGGHRRRARFAWEGEQLHLGGGAASFTFTDRLLTPSAAAETEGASRILAPMNGRVVAVLAHAGDAVAKGQRLVVLEAMKMQHELAAGRDGRIGQLAVKEGDQVATRQLLVALEAEG